MAEAAVCVAARSSYAGSAVEDGASNGRLREPPRGRSTILASAPGLAARTS
jgi:hypothetical protein